ncbi:hypothetical protein QWY93_10055 [Echinicola jeungdonensis]|uniref:Uncharacterized protein n=1 Tax=Echinicola jeungdonensis TaxID=709343 RepID=A0ABV5J8Q0_9BACT|nr:hypothetical protein [Echinicola jeungdonensis]MDN3669668.1 hypothetical protein [Echinicola jeungdonensis]
MNQFNAPYQPQLKSVSIGDWVITIIVTSIPIIGFIFLVVWALDKTIPESKSNYAKACLILYVLFFMLAVLFVGIIGISTFGPPFFSRPH